MKESRYTCVLVFEAAMGRELDTVEQSGRSETLALYIAGPCVAIASSK